MALFFFFFFFCGVPLCVLFPSLFMCGLCYSKWNVRYSVLVVGNDASLHDHDILIFIYVLILGCIVQGCQIFLWCIMVHAFIWENHIVPTTHNFHFFGQLDRLKVCRSNLLRILIYKVTSVDILFICLFIIEISLLFHLLINKIAIASMVMIRCHMFDTLSVIWIQKQLS